MKISHPILILECANSHGGDFELLKATVEQCKQLVYPNKHIKFQAFHPDTIALPDFSWYNVYQELAFSRQQWRELLASLSMTFDGVWLDVFDRYGTEVLADNNSLVTGIKLQASVLENREIISGLQAISLHDKTLMINVSGHELSDIERFINVFSTLNVANIMLQVGHQAYPTQVKDTGLAKVKILRSAFPRLKTCLADHAPAQHDLAGIIPLLGYVVGCEAIEKHICLDRQSTPYDQFSALEPPEMQVLADRLIETTHVLGGTFVCDSERDYLAKSIQVPVAAKKLVAGSLISASDLLYRRTSQDGSTMHSVMEIQLEGQVLKECVDEGATIRSTQFRPACIGVIVACRMKSSRLKNKAILPIAGQSSVERCLENCRRIPSAAVVVLATSTCDEDNALANYTLDGAVKLWRGDPDDVIERYIGACDEFGIDIIVRVTADCPVISPEIAQVLLDHHFRSGADYTAAQECAVGTACEIYNASALRAVREWVGHAQYSEYMTWYMQNNRDLFKVELVDLPKEMLRDYRLTLDYPEDLEMLSGLYDELRKRGEPATLSNIFGILDNNSALASRNSHLTLSYKTDEELIRTLNRETKIRR